MYSICCVIDSWGILVILGRQKVHISQYLFRTFTCLHPYAILVTAVTCVHGDDAGLRKIEEITFEKVRHLKNFRLLFGSVIWFINIVDKEHRDNVKGIKESQYPTDSVIPKYKQQLSNLSCDIRCDKLQLEF